jgi:ADP-ribosylglycohydrolase
VPQCIIALLESKSFIHALQLILSIGGDADTLGCITGSMAEAFYGSKTIPQEMIEFATDRLNDIELKVIKQFYSR